MAPGVDRLIAAVRGDRIHGAAELTRRAAEVLIAAAGAPLDGIARELHAAQPAMAPIWNVCQAALAAQHAGREAVVTACREFVIRMERAVGGVARHALALIPDGSVVATHSASEAVFESFRWAREQKRQFRVLATESRPQCEGVELAERLRATGIETEIVIDAAMAQTMELASVAFVGADSISPSSVVNKVGTRLLALAAHEAGKSLYALCPSMKRWDREAPPVEGFEATPRRLFRAIVTEEGELLSHPSHPARSGTSSSASRAP